VSRLADAAQVRGGSAALGHDLGHGLQRAVLRGAAGAKSDRAELGLQGIQLLARGAQLFGALGRLGREKFKAEREDSWGQTHAASSGECVHKKLVVAVAASDRHWGTSCDRHALVGQALRMRCSTIGIQGHVLHDAALAHLARLQFKLRLDQHHHRRARSFNSGTSAGSTSVSEMKDTIGHDQVKRIFIGLGIDVTSSASASSAIRSSTIHGR
jgi:hypothetical protein